MTPSSRRSDHFGGAPLLTRPLPPRPATILTRPRILSRPPLELLLSTSSRAATILTRPPGKLVELLAVCESRQEQGAADKASLICSHVSQEEGGGGKRRQEEARGDARKRNEELVVELQTDSLQERLVEEELLQLHCLVQLLQLHCLLARVSGRG